jgi:hypothetical protein
VAEEPPVPVRVVNLTDAEPLEAQLPDTVYERVITRLRVK